jgi:pyrimidine and pyridine-specific 5'-nucleotidase
MYAKAQVEAGAASPRDCYFVGESSSHTCGGCYSYLHDADDSYINCKRAQELGWTAVHILEPEDPEPAVRACKYQIRRLEELQAIFPLFFKSGRMTTKALDHSSES